MNTWSDITRATIAQILAWAGAQPWARAMAADRNGVPLADIDLK